MAEELKLTGIHQPATPAEEILMDVIEAACAVPGGGIYHFCRWQYEAAFEYLTERGLMHKIYGEYELNRSKA
jgi:hypothetical protein